MRKRKQCNLCERICKSVYWSVECAIHAFFSIACTIELCHFSSIKLFAFTMIIFAMAFNQRNKINFNIISRLKMRSAMFLLLLLLFGASSAKSHFPFDWWEWWRHCNYYVSDYIVGSVRNVNETLTARHSIQLCRMSDYEYSWDGHISHILCHFLTCLIDTHTCASTRSSIWNKAIAFNAMITGTCPRECR